MKTSGGEPAKNTAPTQIYYHDKQTVVERGDRVRIRVWFRKLQGRIVYVPGKSKPNATMDYDGLISVGIQIQNGPFIASFVQPEGNCLKRKIVFLERDKSIGEELKPDKDPFDE